MYSPLHQFRRLAATIFLVLFLAPTLLLPLARAHATVPTDDLQNNAKEYWLDTAVTAAVKILIREFRNIIIRAIVTGRFGGLSFSTSFTIDARRLVENAAESFMTEFTGLDFCGGAVKIPPESLFAARFDLEMRSCVDNLERLKRGEEFDPVSFQKSFKAEPSDLFLIAQAEKAARENLARTSFTEDYRAGEGFLGNRGANGKIKTPGQAVGDYFQENIASTFREGDVADELSEAIAAIIGTAIDVGIQRGLDEM